MARCGGKPKPTKLKLLEGNPGKRKLNDAEPMPPPAAVAVPAELEGHPVATAEWVRLAPILHTMRVLTAADETSLLALCLEWERYLAATGKIREEGMITTAPSGYPIPNPHLSIASRALDKCLKLWPELGLTPSSRTRIRVEGPGPDGDAFSTFDHPRALAEH